MAPGRAPKTAVAEAEDATAPGVVPAGARCVGWVTAVAEPGAEPKTIVVGPTAVAGATGSLGAAVAATPGGAEAAADEPPKICVLAFEGASAAGLLRPKVIVPFDTRFDCGAPLASGCCGGTAVKTYPQRVHCTGAPPGGSSRSSSEYSIEH